MEKKIVRLTPDQLGYKDRGKMKWMGLMLSDHSESLKRMKQAEEKEPSPKPKQSLAEIGEILMIAYSTGRPVLIQANFLQNGHYFKDVPCMISGTYEEKIYLLLKNGNIVHTTIEDIRNVEFLDPLTWQLLDHSQ